MSFYERKPKGRLREEKKAKEIFNSSDIQDIRNRMGLRSNAPREKIIFELKRLKGKSKATWDVLNLTEKDFKDFGLEIPK